MRDPRGELLLGLLGWILPILAAVAAVYDAGTLALILAAAALAVIVGNTAYDAGYRTGQRDLIDPPHLRPLTEVERNRLLMRATLPRWRRWLGWAAIVVPQLLLLVSVFTVIHYGGSGWLLIPAIVLFFVSLGVGVWGDGVALETFTRRREKHAEREPRRSEARDMKSRALARDAEGGVGGATTGQP